ncbi:MAG TPA: hypothetical protein VF163_10885 [Micromonosporaceae bacterium]
MPAEWGTIVIPDDASALDREAAQLRRELRRDARQAWLRAVFGRPGRRGRRRAQLQAAARMHPAGSARLHPDRAGWGRWGPVGVLRTSRRGPAQRDISSSVPLTIMAVAVLTTIVSLFIVTLGHPSGEASTGPVIASSAAGFKHDNQASTDSSTGTGALASVTLSDPAGATVRLSTLLPAVVLIVDGCVCTPLVLAVARRAPPGVTVVAVGRTAPVIYGGPTNLRTLAASADSPLRARFANGRPGGATSADAILLDRSGNDVAVVSAVDSPADLTGLADLR